jgi:hypothetical protein
MALKITQEDLERYLQLGPGAVFKDFEKIKLKPISSFLPRELMAKK